MKMPALSLAVLSLISSSCARAGQNVWSTKEDSVLRLASVTPDEVMGEPYVIDENLELREQALDILNRASTSTNPLLRANAIEALHEAPAVLPEVVQRALGDENRGVRFVAAVTAGKFKLCDLVSLLEPLRFDESQSVRAAAIYGLHHCGRPVEISPLADMLLGDDPEVKGNAAYVLGELGDPSAVTMLRYATGKGLARATPARRKLVELQLAEAMVKLGSLNELQVIRAKLFAPAEDGELVALACRMCGELGDAAALPNLLDLATRTGRRQQSAEVRMAATLAVAQIDPAQAPLPVAVAFVKSERFELRAQSGYTLGWLRREQALSYLAELLKDRNPLVQVSAAGSVLRLNPK